MIYFSVRILAVLMVLVIIMGVIDVGWTLYQRVLAPPTLILTISDILGVFGAFMAVLIAIEIFINITIYLREDVIHVKIVIATALMAVARKVIILDMEKSEPLELIGLALLVFAASGAYWLVHKTPVFTLNLPNGNSSEDDDKSDREASS
ncbi:phosphate-starvation-inducible PsiE family protein [Roseibium sp.]|uniref:phosphate-starvation-inducible PsiE family protein n=1 Tax=Roseibium sp. TaxID=1936156 RepID=UPI003A97DEDD